MTTEHRGSKIARAREEAELARLAKMTDAQAAAYVRKHRRDQP